MTITSMTPNTTSGRTTIEGRVTTDLTITEISGISLTCSMLGSGSQEFDLTIAKYTLSDGSFTFRGYIRSIGIQAVTEGEVECNATVPNGHPNYLTELRYNTTQHKFM